MKEDFNAEAQRRGGGKEPEENEISRRIIQAAIEVHRELGGPGLLESVYESALAWELDRNGLFVERQVTCPIHYKGVQLDHPFRIDLLVNGLVVVECKASSEHHPIFESQVLTYLRLKKLKLGLVLNFGKATLKDGIHRVVNGL
jgi:GxxExxY protein